MSGASRVGLRYKIRWQGSGTMSLIGCTGNSVSTTSNSYAFTWSATCDSNNLQVRFTSIDVNDPPNRVQVYLESYEARLDAGEVFDPDWLAEVKQAGKIFRWMDGWPINGNVGNFTFASFPSSLSFRTWGNVPFGGANYGARPGMPPALFVELMNQANKQPWINIPYAFGIKGFPLTSFTDGATPVFAATGHDFQDGDKVIVYSIYDGAGLLCRTVKDPVSVASDGTVTSAAHGFIADQPIKFYTNGVQTVPTGRQAGIIYYVSATDLTTDTFKYSATPGGSVLTGATSSVGIISELQNRELTVVNSDPAAGTLGLSGTVVGTTAYGNCTTTSLALGFITKAFDASTLSNITAEVTLFAQYMKDNLNGNLGPHIYERGNEPWNFTFLPQQFGIALATSDYIQTNHPTLVNPQNGWAMDGYLTAHAMKTVKDVYGSTPWFGVLNVQTAWTAPAIGFNGGITAYRTQFSISGTNGDLFGPAGGPTGKFAVTNYSYACFTGPTCSSGFPSTATWEGYMTTANTRYQASLEKDRYAYFNRLAAFWEQTYINTYFNTWWTDTYNQATSFGFSGLIGYEGGTHSTTPASGTWRTGGDLANSCGYWGNYVYSQEVADMLGASYRAALAFGFTPAIFSDAQQPNCTFGPWGFMRWGGGGLAIDNNPRWKMIKSLNYLLDPANDNQPMFLNRAS